MKLLLVLLFNVIGIVSFAQSKHVAGNVADTTGLPLSNVSVNLTSAQKTFVTKTDSSGTFSFANINTSSFELNVSNIGYGDYVRSYSFADVKEDSISIPPIILSYNVQNLPEVVLKPVSAITVKEDTVEYRSDAYKVKDGAMVEDVLKKLPGVSVDRDGIVTAQGKEITRVRVNGKEYFGGDVLTATRNLPANVVENIQVIDDYGEKGKLTGVKDGEPEKILNINIKKGKEKGNFGNATVVAGTRGRYLANVSANTFEGDKQISLVSSINNTNVGSFEFASGSRNGGTGSAPGFMDRGGNGVSRQSTLALNYRDVWNKKITAYGSLTFNGRRNETEGNSYQQDINAQSISTIRNTNKSEATGNNQRLSWNIEYKIDTSNYLKVSPQVSLASSKNNFKGYSEFTKPSYSTSSEGTSFGSDLSPTWGLDVFYLHKLKKPRRNLSISANLNNTLRNQERDVNNTFFNVDSSQGIPLPSSNFQNQSIRHKNETVSSNLRVSFNEPINKVQILEFSYALNQTNSKNVRSVEDIDQSTGEKVKNTNQSNDFNYTFTTHRLGFNLYGNEKKYNYTIGIAGQPSLLTGTDERRLITTRNANFNLVPSARFQYKLTKNRSLTASYNSSNREPGFTQLQPVFDSSNLKTVIRGNPDLRPEFTNRFRLQYNQAGLLSGRSLFANISFDKTQNKIVSSRVNDANGTGRTLSYLNTDGFYGINGSVSITQSFLKKRLSVTFNQAASFDNNISFTDNQRNTGHNLTLRPEVLVRLDIPDKIDISVNSGYTLNTNNTQYATQSFVSKVQTIHFGIAGKNYYKEDWTLGYDLSKMNYIGYLKNFNASPTILNMFVERRVLLNRRGTVRVQAFDLFNQNIGIGRYVNGSTITDVQNNRLSRYFLVSFNYKLQRFRGK